MTSDIKLKFGLGQKLVWMTFYSLSLFYFITNLYSNFQVIHADSNVGTKTLFLKWTRYTVKPMTRYQENVIENFFSWPCNHFALMVSLPWRRWPPDWKIENSFNNISPASGVCLHYNFFNFLLFFYFRVRIPWECAVTFLCFISTILIWI